MTESTNLAGGSLNREVLRKLKREHVEQALDDLDRGVQHQFGSSSGYDLTARDRTYPPKAVFGIALGKATGRQFGKNDFQGGATTVCNKTLAILGYEIVKKGEARPEPTEDLTDPDQVEHVFEQLLFVDPEVKAAWLAVLEKCLALCVTNPAGWALTLPRNYCSLNAGYATVLSLRQKFVLFSCFLESLPAADRAWLGEVQELVEDFNTYEGMSLVWVPSRHAAEALRRFEGAILQAVETALAAKKGLSHYRRFHSDAVVEYLESVIGRPLPRPNYQEKGMCYWKVSPDSGARMWPRWRSEGYASIGWPELGDLRRFSSRSEFDAARAQLGAEFQRMGLGQLWQFRGIKPGDVVVANRGTSEVVGIGDVVEGYHFDSRDVEHPHRVKVQWRDIQAFPVNQGGWRKTLIQLGKADFNRLLEGREPPAAPEAKSGPPGDVGSGMGSTFQRLREHLDVLDLRFSGEVLADFLLALQTKRFVILSGVSGTGKSRLAIEVARFLQPTVTQRIAEADDAATTLDIRPYMVKYHRMVLPVSLVAELELSPRAEGSMSVEVVTPDGAEPQRLWRDTTRDVSVLLFSKGVREWADANLEEGGVLKVFIERAGERPKLRLAVPKMRTETRKLANLEVVAVRPDWTDHRGLLGYFNPITEQYVSTPFLELLLRAEADCRTADDERRPPHPFFVLLDEMNLARVEHYFADFLSAMESGHPLHLHDSPTAAEGEKSTASPVPQRLKIPRNVFFVGTVNVDESTYMFSPKVLDRAFTLEFNRVDLGDPGDEEGGLRLDHLPASLVPERGATPEDWEALRRDHGDLARVVEELHAMLAQEHRHFGYRVANEIARFVLLAIAQAGLAAGKDALDLALLHKVLPKLHGSQQELECLLDRLLAFAVRGENAPVDEDKRTAADTSLELVGERLQRRAASSEQSEAEVDPVAFPRMAGKLFRMRRRLLRQGFTSFIE